MVFQWSMTAFAHISTSPGWSVNTLTREPEHDRADLLRSLLASSSLKSDLSQVLVACAHRCMDRSRTPVYHSSPIATAHAKGCGTGRSCGVVLLLLLLLWPAPEGRCCGASNGTGTGNGRCLGSLHSEAALFRSMILRPARGFGPHSEGWPRPAGGAFQRPEIINICRTQQMPTHHSGPHPAGHHPHYPFPLPRHFDV